MKTAASERIAIAPVGDLDPDLIDAVRREVQRVFGIETTLLTSLLPDLAFAFNADREQYCSTLILAKMAEAPPPGALKVLAVTEADLFIPILTHVYGEAQLGGRACIVSTFRLDAAPGGRRASGRTAERLAKEALHELGHTFSLRHCRDPRCLMHYCRSEADVDRKSSELCRYCQVMLEDEVRRLRGGS